MAAYVLNDMEITEVILEFSSVEQARAWVDSPEYAPARRLRQWPAKLDLIVAERVPLA